MHALLTIVAKSIGGFVVLVILLGTVAMAFDNANADAGPPARAAHTPLSPVTSESFIASVCDAVDRGWTNADFAAAIVETTRDRDRQMAYADLVGMAKAAC